MTDAERIAKLEEALQLAANLMWFAYLTDEPVDHIKRGRSFRLLHARMKELDIDLTTPRKVVATNC